MSVQGELFRSAVERRRAAARVVFGCVVLKTIDPNSDSAAESLYRRMLRLEDRELAEYADGIDRELRACGKATLGAWGEGGEMRTIETRHGQRIMVESIQGEVQVLICDRGGRTRHPPELDFGRGAGAECIPVSAGGGFGPSK